MAPTALFSSFLLLAGSALAQSDSSGSMMMTSMTFISGFTTPLYSMNWAPSSKGQYAGSCVFLIILAFLSRAAIAFKATMERRWLEQALHRRYVVVADKNRLSDEVRQSEDSKTAVLSVRGVEQDVKLAHAPGSSVQPWRFSVDLPRSFLYLIIATIGYLLMLAVMTFNVGYFLSILGGTFLGEVVWGRIINAEHH